MKLYAALGLAAMIAGLGATGAHAQSSIYVYNFNDGVAGNSPANTTNLFTVDRVNQGASTTGSRLSSSFAQTNITSFGGTALNADGKDGAGQALALQGGTNNVNNGAYLQATANLTGFQAGSFSFATQGTGSGFNSDQFQYSLDGTSFTNFGAAYTPPSAFALQTFDLSGIAGLNNNANAAFRIVFNGASATTGNNRLDNLIISGTKMGGVVTPPVPEASTTVSLGLMLALGGLAFAVKKKKASVAL